MDTPIDRKYNAQNLKEVLPLLEGMEYFVFYGTLLGLVREGDILEKDDDIDILVDRKHFAELIERFDKHDGLLTYDNNPNVNYCDFFRQATCIRDGVKTFADFYFYDTEIKPGSIVDRWNIHGSWNDPNMHIIIPNDIIYPIETKSHKKYGEMNYPSQPELCLEYLYGKGWMHPRKKKKEYIQAIKNNRPHLVYLGQER